VHTGKLKFHLRTKKYSYSVKRLSPNQHGEEDEFGKILLSNCGSRRLLHGSAPVLRRSALFQCAEYKYMGDKVRQELKFSAEMICNTGQSINGDIEEWKERNTWLNINRRRTSQTGFLINLENVTVLSYIHVMFFM
jgi:hypothetical protein